MVSEVVGTGGRILKEIKQKVQINSVQWEHTLRYGIDGMFMSRVAHVSGTQTSEKASDFLKIGTDGKSGTFTFPAEENTVAVYSIKTFRNPHFTYYGKLPRLSLVGDETSALFFLGLETGGKSGNAIFSFRLIKTSTYDNLLTVSVGGQFSSTNPSMDIYKPSDFDTADHRYGVKVARNLAMLLVDGTIIFFAIPTGAYPPTTIKYNVKPYGIAFIPCISPSLSLLMEYTTNRSTTAPSDVTFDFNPTRLCCQEGSDIIPLTLPLYIENSDTKLAGYSISSGSVTSHEVPIFGYTKKTLYFHADQSGTLEIEIYTTTKNWRTYDTQSVSANTLLSYNIDAEGILARVIFTPSTYPCTVNEAEIILC